MLNKAASKKKCHQIHTYGILFLQYLIQVLSLVVYWPVTTKRLTRKHIHEYVTIMYFPILIRIHGKKSAVAVDVQENRYMQYKCHCLLFPAGQTSFQKRYVNLRWVLPYRLLTIPQDCLTKDHVTSKQISQTGVSRSGRFLSPVQSLDLVG